MTPRQENMVRCACGKLSVVRALSAYEFEWDCCGGTMKSWAHAQPAPEFTPHVLTGLPFEDPA